MDVFDHEQSRLAVAQPLYQPGEQRVFALIAGGDVHGVVKALEFGRLREIEQFVKKHPLIGRAKLASQRLHRRGLARRNIAAGGNGEQTADQCTYRVLALANAEIEVEAFMVSKAALLGVGLELLDKPGLSHSGLTAHKDRLTIAGKPT